MDEVGAYRIKAILLCEEDENELVESKEVRIVNYREEIKDLFTEFLRRMEGTGIQISKDQTPREIQRLLKKELVDVESVDTVKREYVRAKYSPHKISRENYVNIYIAIREVKDSED